MPEIRITEPQELRFDSLREELAETHVDRYGTVRDQDVVAYLLDLADAVEDPDRAADPAGSVESDETDENDEIESSEETEPEDGAEGESDDDEPDGDEDTDGKSRLDVMMSLLDTHDDKWRESDGEARYEVDLPDGGTETAQTKDDVRALLFKNY